MRTESHEEANSSFSQFCERTEKAMWRKNVEIETFNLVLQ